MGSVVDDVSPPSAAYIAASDWIVMHIAELARQYPNQWVAVHDGRVVGASAELGKTRASAESVAPRNDIAYHFIDDGTLIF